MLREERIREIEKIVRNNGKVEVMQLCRQFGVSEMTIRRDLNEMSDRRMVVRSHGGAMLPIDQVLAESPQEMRALRHHEEKLAIAKEALNLINEGDRVFFDSSTTVLCLAQMISNAQKLLVVTDTLHIATEVNSRSNAEVICLGGELQKNTGSCGGFFAEQMLSSMRFNTAFIGLPKISMDGILSTASVNEMRVKQSVMARSEKTVILIDSSKVGEPEFLQIGRLSDVDIVITDSNMSREFLDYCAELGVDTIIAQI